MCHDVPLPPRNVGSSQGGRGDISANSKPCIGRPLKWAANKRIDFPPFLLVGRNSFLPLVAPTLCGICNLPRPHWSVLAYSRITSSPKEIITFEDQSKQTIVMLERHVCVKMKTSYSAHGIVRLSSTINKTYVNVKLAFVYIHIYTRYTYIYVCCINCRSIEL